MLLILCHACIIVSAIKHTVNFGAHAATDISQAAAKSFKMGYMVVDKTHM